MSDYKSFTFHVPTEHSSVIVVDVDISIPVAFNGYPTPRKNSLRVKALIDTGATRSAIKHSFVETVKPPSSYGRSTVKTSQGEYISSIYVVDIHFPGGMTALDVRVTEFFTSQGFDAIIGMDILRMGDMAITNAQNHTVFSFRVPSDTKHIDFTQKTAESGGSNAPN